MTPFTTFDKWEEKGEYDDKWTWTPPSTTDNNTTASTTATTSTQQEQQEQYAAQGAVKSFDLKFYVGR